MLLNDDVPLCEVGVLPAGVEYPSAGDEKFDTLQQQLLQHLWLASFDVAQSDSILMQPLLSFTVGTV